MAEKAMVEIVLLATLSCSSTSSLDGGACAAKVSVMPARRVNKPLTSSKHDCDCMKSKGDGVVVLDVFFQNLNSLRHENRP